MTLPVSGAISFADINQEIYGSSSTAAASLNDSVVRNIFGVSSGQIDMNTGHDKAYTIPGNSGVITDGSSYTLPRTSGKTISVLVVAGGAGGGGGSYRTLSGYVVGGGGGGSGANAYTLSIPVTPGQSVSFSIGGGGSAGLGRDGIYGNQGNVGSSGGTGGATSFTVNGTTYAYANGGNGGIQSPDGSRGGTGSISTGTQAIYNDYSTSYPAATYGGNGSSGININTTVGYSIGSIVSVGSVGLGGQGRGGGPGQTGTGYGAGGGGGGCSQSDQGGQQNGTWIAAAGATGAVFIWWGY